MVGTLYDNKRIVWIDWTKFILIALVCVCHFQRPEIQRILIFGFHMPAFFIISGYLYHPHNAFRTMWSFVVPVVFYSTLVFGIHIIQDVIQTGTWDYQLDFGHFWHRVLAQFFVRDNSPYGTVHVFMGIWFVIGLMVTRFLAGDIKCFSFTLHKPQLTLVALLAWITIESYIWKDQFPLRYWKFYYGIYAMPFFLTGYIACEKEVDFHMIHPLHQILFLAVFLGITLNFPRYNMLTYSYTPHYLVFFVNAICGSTVLFWLCTWLPECSLAKIFSIGTLLILPMHMSLDFFILPVFHRIGLTPPANVLMGHFIPWIEVVVVLAICYFPIKWLSKHYPLLLGKIPKKNNH